VSRSLQYDVSTYPIYSLESQLNVLGLSSATHDSVEGTLDLAIAKYLQAVEDGDVSIISPAYTEDNEHFI
jgi:hypothetical protein